MRKSTGVFKVGLDTELGWTTTKEHLSRIDMPVTVSENEKQTVMTLIDTRVSSIESNGVKDAISATFLFLSPHTQIAAKLDSAPLDPRRRFLTRRKDKHWYLVYGCGAGSLLPPREGYPSCFR